jgi:hypothetical protein
LAVYEIPVNEDGAYDFFKFRLVTVNAEVTEKLRQSLADMGLVRLVRELRNFETTGNDNSWMYWRLYEIVIAQYLVSPAGVKWQQRSGRSAKSGPALPKKTFKLKLSSAPRGVPVYAKMEPMTLYTSLDLSFPLCDLVYKEHDIEGKKGKLVCIQVTTEATGKRTVSLTAFERFCVRMGWSAKPSKKHAALISYVYCPIPALADQAEVKFEGGVGIDGYAVWYVDLSKGGY